MKYVLPLMAVGGALLIATPDSAIAAPAPNSASTLEGAASAPIERVRHRRRHRVDDRYDPRRGVSVFIIPGLYWGPAWWDPNYNARQNRKRGKCNNWIFAC
jgi:hypothetical protein